MANFISMSLVPSASTCLLLLLTIAMTHVSLARVLDEEPPSVAPTDTPAVSGPVSTPSAATAPGSSLPAAAAAPIPITTTPPVTAPVAPSMAPPAESNAVTAPAVAPTASIPVATPSAANAPVAAATAPETATTAAPDHTLSFFLHDILGGSNPSARIVAGIATNAAVNGQLPFAKPNGAVLPLNGGVPGNTATNGLINNNNIPFLTGLGGSTNAVIQNNNGNPSGLPFFAGGNLPEGTTLQKLMFGTLTVIDDELSEGPELGSGLLGKAQGFYVDSSVDGTSQAMAFTAMFKEGEYAHSLSFFGVHRTAESESHVAVVGGTGKYVNAKGYAIVDTLRPADQHETDGVESVLQFKVYLV